MKDILKNKKVVVIGLLIIGIVILIVGIKLVFKDSEPSNNPNQVEKISTFAISNFEADLTQVDIVKVFFKIQNTGSKDISEKTLKINFYSNKELLSTYEYAIKNLKANESIYVEGEIGFSYYDIDTYEFVIDNEKIVVKPTN